MNLLHHPAAVLVLALSCAIVAGGAQGASADAGLLGMTLPQAQQTDLFTFFSLAQVGKPTGAGAGSVTVFKPEADAFHALVRLAVTRRADGRIEAMSLTLARSFIAGQQSIFARDIAASFLRDAIAVANQPAAYRSLVAQIGNQQNPDIATLQVSRRPPPVPPAPTREYLVYTGAAARATLQLAQGGELQLQNLDVGGTQSFVASVRMNPTPQSVGEAPEVAPATSARAGAAGQAEFNSLENMGLLPASSTSSSPPASAHPRMP